MTPGLVKLAVTHSGWMMYNAGAVNTASQNVLIMDGERKIVQELKQLKLYVLNTI